MAYETNKHVERLRQYILFQPSHGQLYEEYVADAGVAPRVETKVLRYVAGLLAEPGVRLIVLTGDAGHGKTHTCRRLLESMGATPGDALASLLDKGDGASPFRGEDGRFLRVVKDPSDTCPSGRPGRAVCGGRFEGSGVRPGVRFAVSRP